MSSAHFETKNCREERAVIGSLLLDNSLYFEITGTLTLNDFEYAPYGEIYKVISEILGEGGKADLIIVSDRLSKNGNNSSNDWFIELCDISNEVFALNCIKHYVEIIKSKSMKRKLVNAAQNIIASVRGNKEHVLDFAQHAIASIAENVTCAITQAKDILPEVLEELGERNWNSSTTIGLPTGFNDLDKVIHGLKGGELVIIAGRPGMGKTIFAMNIIENVALAQNQPAIIFSLEMRNKELVERLIASTAHVNSNDMRSGKLNENDFQKIASSVPPIQSAKLFIDDRSSPSVMDIRSMCRHIKMKHGLALIIIDYIGLMSGDGENETIRISNISRGLKLIARDLDIPVIAISQLNRGVENRNDKRPMMSDLRQSGAIEQDADLILFVYRDEVYHENIGNKGIAELIIGKHRNGNLGTVHLTFNNNYCRFDNPTTPILAPSRAKRKHSGFEYKGL